MLAWIVWAAAIPSPNSDCRLKPCTSLFYCNKNIVVKQINTISEIEILCGDSLSYLSNLTMATAHGDEEGSSLLDKRTLHMA
jgi:hypothetical protein